MIRPIIRDLIKNRFYSKEHVSNLPIISIPPYSNIIENGEPTSTTGWSVGNNSCVLTSANNTLIATGNGLFSQITARYETNTAYVSDTKYFVIAKVRTLGAGASSLKIRIFGSNPFGTIVESTIDSPVQNQWYPISYIRTLPSDGGQFVTFDALVTYSDNATANGKVMEVQQAEVVNLTVPAETSTDLSYLSMKYPFNPNALGGNLQLKCMGVDGGSSEQDVDIVGKNKINNVLLRTDSNYNLSSWYGAYKAIAVPIPNGIYKFSTFWGNGYKAIFEQYSTCVISLTTSINGGALPDNSFFAHSTSPSVNNDVVYTLNVTNGFIYFSTYGMADDRLISFFTNVQIQLEKNVVTTYEPYNATRLHVQQLNGVGAIKDELYLTDWKLPNISEPIKAGTGTKRADQKILQVSDVAGLRTTYTNLDYIRITKPLDYFGYNYSAIQNDKYTLDIYTNVYTVDYDNASNIGKCVANADGNEIWVGVTKDSMTLEQVQTALAGKKLTYVLAQYQPINIEPWTYGLIGDLKYRQGGSIVQNAIAPCQITLQFETPY